MRNLPALKRTQQVIELLHLKATVAEMMEILDLPRREVLREIAIAERLEDQDTRKMVGRMRQIQHERLEAVQEAHEQAALAGDMQAAGLYLRAMKQQSKLLGLDAPEQKELRIEGDVDIGLQQLDSVERDKLRARLMGIAKDEDTIEVEAEDISLLTSGD